jgi:hypothetical protein
MCGKLPSVADFCLELTAESLDVGGETVRHGIEWLGQILKKFMHM